MSAFDVAWPDLLLRLGLSVLLGGIIGWERERSEKMAGLRTHILVSLGSALFTVISIEFVALDPKADASRIAAQIVTGIGFLGAGAILKQGLTIQGLTTAASLWVTAAIGMAAGFGQHAPAAAGTVLALATLVVIGRLPVMSKSRRHFPVASLVATYQVGTHQRIVDILLRQHFEVSSVTASLIEGKTSLERVHVLMRVPPTTSVERLLEEVRKIPGVRMASVEIEGPLAAGADAA